MSKRWNYFEPGEVVGLDEELVAKLDLARYHANVPFVITSGIRTAEENTSLGGAKNSAHLRGLAVDLACEDGLARKKIAEALMMGHFHRIIFYDRHIHCDMDPSLPEGIWLKSGR